MWQRIDQSRSVVESVESNDHKRCMDMFNRPGGILGEEFRRDPEDEGR